MRGKSFGGARRADIDHIGRRDPADPRQRRDHHDGHCLGAAVMRLGRSRRPGKDRGEKFRNSDIAGDNRQCGENHQRDRHRRRRFVDMLSVLRVHPGWPPECDEYQARAVEGRQERRHQPDDGQCLSQRAGRPRADQDLILAEEP